EGVLVAHRAPPIGVCRAGTIVAAARVSWGRPGETTPIVSGDSPEKFTPPVVTNVVSRPRLNPSIAGAAAAPVTVGAAGAGGGETRFAGPSVRGRGGPP